MTRKLLITLCCTLALATVAHAQKKNKKEKATPAQVQAVEPGFDESALSAMKWRCIGPFRGGRSTTVCGVVQDPMTYYFGSVGGGLWKTVDGGKRWRNITDGQINTGSVGAVAVAPSDPNVIYLGMGEAPIRGVMTSSGDGVYKSTDGGHTWHHTGLDHTFQIAQIRVHPDNPNLVYVAAQGNPYGPSAERGIYRSADGGASWELVQFVDENSGACDLSMDMNNPRVLYAAFWDHTRYPWKMRSGGEGSGIWKSMDAGTTWSELTTGLPDSIMGKIGVSVSAANSDRVYAI
ncbi:MAG: glycosyl hydrolase, partial [Saprospiraceae bacterium]|nr:glycosyl hydrolase [Saprospiraceae bacterium]